MTHAIRQSRSRSSSKVSKNRRATQFQRFGRISPLRADEGHFFAPDDHCGCADAACQGTESQLMGRVWSGLVSVLAIKSPTRK